MRAGLQAYDRRNLPASFVVDGFQPALVLIFALTPQSLAEWSMNPGQHTVFHAGRCLDLDPETAEVVGRKCQERGEHQLWNYSPVSLYPSAIGGSRHVPSSV